MVYHQAFLVFATQDIQTAIVGVWEKTGPTKTTFIQPFDYFKYLITLASFSRILLHDLCLNQYVYLKETAV